MPAQARTDHIHALWESPAFPGSTHDGVLELTYTSGGELNGLTLESSYKLARPADSDDQEFGGIATASLEHIFGACGERKVTLFNATGLGGTWAPLAFLEGAHLARNEPRVKSLTGTITNFEPWLNGIPGAKGYDTGDHVGFSAPKSTVIFTQKTAVGTVTLLYNVAMPSPSAFGVSLVPKLVLKLELAQSKTLPCALKLLSDTCSLFVLISGVPIRQTGSVRLDLENNETAWFRYRRTDKEHETTNYPFAWFSDRVSALPDAVARWFALTDKTREVLGKLAIFLVSRVEDYEEGFLQACRIAESFARLLDDQGYVCIPRDGKRRNFEDCLKVLFAELMANDSLSKTFAQHEPQFSTEGSRRLTDATVDQFLANVLWTRDELTHLVLDKPKLIGRVLATKELRPTTYTVAFAAVCKAVRLLLGPLGTQQATQLERSLATAYAVKQQVGLNQLFN